MEIVPNSNLQSKYNEFVFSNGLLNKPIKEFSEKLKTIFPEDKYSTFREQVVELFSLDQKIGNIIDNNTTINKIFLLEIKIIKMSIIKLMDDVDKNSEQANLLSEFLILVDKNLNKLNKILESKSDNLYLQGGALVTYSSDLTATKNFITTKWIELVDEIFESNNLEESIINFIEQIFKLNGFKLTDQDKLNINQIIKSMCANLKIISRAKNKLSEYNNKYTNLGLSQSIKSIESIKKTSIILLTKTFLDIYLDNLLYVVEHKISSIEKILNGGLKKINLKHLRYKIEYLINKKI